MSALTKVFRDLVPRKRAKPVGKPLTEPDAAYGKPRPMTGFLATLTAEQRKVALDGVETDLLGDPAKANKR